MHQKAAVVEVADGVTRLAPDVAATYRELGIRNPQTPAGDPSAAEANVRSGAKQLATLALVAGSIFFAVLFVGFAYEWKTGALDWVRAIRAQHDLKRRQAFPIAEKRSPQESVLSA